MSDARSGLGEDPEGEPVMSSGASLRQAGKSVSKLAAGEAVNKITRFVATVILARTLIRS